MLGSDAHFAFGMKPLHHQLCALSLCQRLALTCSRWAQTSLGRRRFALLLTLLPLALGLAPAANADELPEHPMLYGFGSLGLGYSHVSPSTINAQLRLDSNPIPQIWLSVQGRLWRQINQLDLQVGWVLSAKRSDQVELTGQRVVTGPRHDTLKVHGESQQTRDIWTAFLGMRSLYFSAGIAEHFDAGPLSVGVANHMAAESGVHRVLQAALLVHPSTGHLGAIASIHQGFSATGRLMLGVEGGIVPAAGREFQYITFDVGYVLGD